VVGTGVVIVVVGIEVVVWAFQTWTSGGGVVVVAGIAMVLIMMVVVNVVKMMEVVGILWSWS
jgi:hypothetical protein